MVVFALQSEWYRAPLIRQGKKYTQGDADEILDQMRSLTGGGHAHVFLRRTIEGRSALYPV